MSPNDVSMDVDPIEPPSRHLLKLKSNDGKCYSFTRTEAFCSNTLRTMIESVGGGQAIIQIDLTSEMLSNVLEWCRRHGSADWEKSFLESFDEMTLLQLVHAANYLDLTTLFNASCKLIAKRWEGKKVEEIRRMYNITSDFEPEQEHQMIQECKRFGLTD